MERFYRDRYVAEERGSHASEDEPTFEIRVRRALRLMGSPPRRVLDFGCGSGVASARFAAAGHRVTGIDISESAIRVARARVPHAAFYLVRADDALPLPDQSFDVCYASEVLEHVFDVLHAMREIHRVLRHEGMLIITTPYHGLLKNLIIALTCFDQHYDPTSGHIRFFTPSSLTHCLDRCGFRVISVTGVGRFYPLWKSMFVVAIKS